jgi:hypothetical protein
MLERWMRSSAFFEAQLREHEITSSRESEEVSPGVILDFDADNQVVGVEILNLSKRSPKLTISGLLVLANQNSKCRRGGSQQLTCDRMKESNVDRPQSHELRTEKEAVGGTQMTLKPNGVRVRII